MAWYDEKSQVSYIATYKNDKDMKRDLEQAIRRGWKLQDTTADGGHVNLGRTATGAVLTGGLSLLVGGSRSKGSHTLVFVRDEAYIAKQRLEQAIVGAKGAYERLARAERDEEAAAVFVTRRATVDGSADLLRERMEKDLRESLEDLSKRRSAAVLARDQFLSAGTVVRDCRAAASSLGVTVVADMLGHVDRLDAFAQTQARRRALVEAEKSALPFLVAVERCAKDYFRAHERLKDSTGKRQAAEPKGRGSPRGSRIRSAGQGPRFTAPTRRCRERLHQEGVGVDLHSGGLGRCRQDPHIRNGVARCGGRSLAGRRRPRAASHGGGLNPTGAANGQSRTSSRLSSSSVDRGKPTPS